MSLEDAFKALGKFGKYQIITYILVGLSFGLTANWQLFAIVFIGYINPHHCKTKPNETNSVPAESGSYEGLAKCLQYQDGMVNKTVTCTNGYEYSLDGFGERGTITMEWDLVCEKDWFVELSQTLFNVGVVCGFFFFTPFGDRFGRKKVFFTCQGLMSIFGVAMSFAPNFEAFCAFQFLTGACAAGLFLTGLVLACEMFPVSMRATVAPATAMFVSFGMITLDIWALVFPNWRHLQLAVSVAGGACLIYYFWCPESIRWLLIRDNEEEARRLLNIAARFNGKILPEDLDLTDDDVDGADKKPSLIPYVKNRRCLQFFVIMMFMVLVNNFMYYGLSLMMGALGGASLYVNFLINSVVELPAVATAILCMHFVGRRWPLCIFQVFSGIMMAIASAVSVFEYTDVDKEWLLTGLAFATKFGVGGAYGVSLIYAQEIFPTNLRSTGLGLVAAAGFIGSIAAPYSVYLYRLIPWVPTTIFAVLSVAAGLLTLLLPETTGRDLPTTVEEIGNWSLALTSEEKESIKEKKKVKKEEKKLKKANASVSSRLSSMNGEAPPSYSEAANGVMPSSYDNIAYSTPDATCTKL